MTSQVYIIQQIKKTKTFWGMAVLFNLREKVKLWLENFNSSDWPSVGFDDTKEEEYYYDRLSRSDVRPIS